MFHDDWVTSNRGEVIYFALLRQVRLLSERAALPGGFMVLHPDQLSALNESFLDDLMDDQIYWKTCPSLSECVAAIEKMDVVYLQPGKWSEDPKLKENVEHRERLGRWKTVW